MKIPYTILENFFENNFEIRATTKLNEIRIDSIYEDDKKKHLYISLDQGVFHCKKSGIGGRVERLIADFIGIPQEEVLYYIIKNYSVKSDKQIELNFNSTFEVAKELTLPDGIEYFIFKKSGPVRDRAYKYLVKRKISEELINELGYIAFSNEGYDNRIFIPFVEKEKIVYFQTRDFTGKSKLRYKNPTGFNSKEFVYNYDKINEEIFIFEGLFDAMSLREQVGTAILSANLTKNQIIKIYDKGVKEIILIPDNDKTGEKTLQENVDLLNYCKPPSSKAKIYIWKVPEIFKDFNEYSIETNNFSIDKKQLKSYNKLVNFNFSLNKKINIDDL
jgi:hypothetical protein